MVENRQKLSSQAEDCVLPVKLLPSKFHLLLSSAEQQQIQSSSAHPLCFPALCEFLWQFLRQHSLLLPDAPVHLRVPSILTDVPLTHLKVEVHKEQKTRCGSPATGPTHAKLVCHEGFPIPGKKSVKYKLFETIGQ